jgi:glycosyltransferase involved in cell wall biosynthesis
MDRENLEKEYELWLLESEKTPNLHDPVFTGEKKITLSSEEQLIDHARRTAVRRRYEKKLYPHINPIPLVSIIMPTYKRSDFITESIKSVLSQTFKDFTLIVINDGGSDEIEDILRNFQDNRIEYLKIPHKGLSGALNTGLMFSESKYISYLDDDDIYYSDHLETLVTFLEEENRSVAYSDCYCARQEKIDNKYITLSKDVIYSRDFDPWQILVRNYIPVLSIMHRRDCIFSTGYFNEKLPLVMDWELWAHMAQKFEFYHIKKITGEYRVRNDKTNMSSDRLRMKVYYELVRKYLMDKYILQNLKNFIHKGDYERTAELLRIYLGEYPSSVKLHFLQGFCHFKAGNLYYALKSCNRGINYFIQPFLDEINGMVQNLMY